MFLSKLFEKQLENAFYQYGRFIARNSISSIIICVLLNGLLGLNILWIKSNSDIETVYTPTNSQAKQDGESLRKLFPDYSGSNFYIQNLLDLGRYGSLIIRHPEGKNIIDRTYKSDITCILEIAENITIEHNQETFSYKELCARRNNTCVTSQSVLLSEYFWKQVDKNNVSFPYFEREDGQTESLSETIGNIEVDEIGRLVSANALKIMMYLRQDNDMFKSLAAIWEQKFLKVFDNFMQNNLTIAYSNSESLDKELDSNTDGDITYFSLTFTLMITYASFVAAGGNCVSQRGHLGRAGVIASGLAILGAFGVGSAVGIEFVNIVGVMPFLIIGIGVDDMFILMSAHADAPSDKSPEIRIGNTVKSSGVAITITSLTNVTAFAVGTLSSFQSVRNFCFYSGVAVFLCYVNQMTFFLGCMSINEKRVAANRHCVTCQIVDSAEELKKERASCCKIGFCSGSSPLSRSDQESFLERLPAIVLPKLILWLPFKIGVLLGTCAYVGISIWGVLNLKQGLLLRNLVSESSYYHFYSNWDYDYFPSKFVISFVVPSKIDYSSRDSQTKLENLLNLVHRDQGFDNEQEINWLKAYTRSDVYNNASSALFCSNLKTFLSQNTMYSNDVIFGQNCSISHSRIHFVSKSIKESYEQGQLMLRIRKITENAPFGVFAFSPGFIYFEQYVAVLPNTLQTVGISVAAVFVVTCIFLSHPLVILFVTVSMAMIMIGVIGFMHIWGLSLSSITMIHIIMSVGFSVDYSAHICHAYLVVEEENRNARVNEAIIRSGGPIFNGALSSLIGIITLAFSQSYVFTSFFKIMLLVILFGLGQAIFFLPVVLSLVGPRFISKNNINIVFTKEFTGTVNEAFES